jgi:hypothetical protein
MDLCADFLFYFLQKLKSFHIRKQTDRQIDRQTDR